MTKGNVLKSSQEDTGATRFATESYSLSANEVSCLFPTMSNGGKTDRRQTTARLLYFAHTCFSSSTSFSHKHCLFQSSCAESTLASSFTCTHLQVSPDCKIPSTYFDLYSISLAKQIQTDLMSASVSRHTDIGGHGLTDLARLTTYEKQTDGLTSSALPPHQNLNERTNE